MNKKGLIGKIFAVIGILLLIVLIIAGITAYQAYVLVKTIEKQTPLIQQEVLTLTKSGDCTKIISIESRTNLIKQKANSACKNPIISKTVESMEQITIKCKDIPLLEEQLQIGLKPFKEYCANKTTTT